MERVTRFIGIALLVGLAALSIVRFNEAVAEIPESAPVRAVPLPDTQPIGPEGREPIASVGTDGDVPQYLAFGEPIRSGIYEIADLPTSDDRDVTESTKGKDLSYPPETDLVPGLSLAGPGQLTPGLYATAFGVTDCSFELRRIMRDKEEAIIGKDRLSQGRMLVSINEIEPDTFSSVPNCGDWMPWSPLAEPLTVVGNGDYWIGDLSQGDWTVPEDCIWEKVVGFRGAKLWDVQDSGYGPETLTVDDETLGVRIRGCGTTLQHESIS